MTAQPLRYASGPGRWVLAATVLGSGMAALDSTVVGIALPVMGRDFSAGTGALQLVVSGYILTLAALLLLGGALGDRYGRRRVFLLGVVWFAGASAACGLAPDIAALIAARAIQGMGAALMTPGSLAILEASFAPEDRARAIGAWSGLGGVATALGPLVGGYLIGSVSWRGVFFINIPVALLVVVISARHVPESRGDAGAGFLDVPGAALITLGLAGVTFGVVGAGSSGWLGPAALAPLLAGVAGVAGFLWRESVAASPMLPLTMFGSHQFSAANAVTFMVYGALGGALFLLPVQLEQVGGYSPLDAGLAMLPVTAIMLVLSSRSGALAARIGPRLQMAVGPLLVGAGLVLMIRIGPGARYAGDVLPAVVVFGLGLAATVAPLTITVMGAAPALQAGMASAVNNAVARTAGLLAVAGLPVAAGITGDAYRHAAVFNAGFHRAVVYAGAACAAAGGLAWLTVEGRVARPLAHHCGLDAPPLRGAADQVEGPAQSV
jgi:EmrB/QacA subfamily drug resistance transporter